MAVVTAQQVADYLGRGDDPALVALAAQHVAIVSAFVSAYTRGRGFLAGVPADDLAGVILTVTARSVVNPEQVIREQSADYSVTPAVAGFSLPELFVLNGYRRRTA